MATLALQAGDNAVANNVTFVSSALAASAKAFLAGDFATDAVVRFDSTSAAAQIEVVDSNGHRIGFVPGEGSGVAVKLNTGDWVFDRLVSPPAAFVANGSETAAVQAILAVLRALGAMKAE